ncbi:MAG: hypothetical protein LBQ15_07320 [Clostridium sp.]|jgi:hypothetical protein|nr:hypothetical protein [Clostridium sp.]
MRVTIDGRTYRGATATALIEEIKEMNWGATKVTDAEGYIAIQEDTYKKFTGKKLKLPKGDTEARAIAMFEAIAAIGAWQFNRED